MKRERKYIYLAIIFAILFTLLTLFLNSQALTNLNLFFNTFAEKIQNPILTFVSVLFAYLFDTLTLSLISLPIAGYLWIKDKKRIAIIFLLIMLITAISVYTLKQGIENPRPLNGLMTETSQSFPSGHATMSVVFFGLVWIILKNKNKTLKSFLIIMPILVSLSRVYLNVHWFTDVLAGAILGAFWLVIVRVMIKEN